MCVTPSSGGGGTSKKWVIGELPLAARRKRAKYPNCAVTPFMVEDHGRLGEEAVALVKRLAPVATASRSAAIRKLHQAMGCVLQRHAADALLAATVRSRR